jgi:hypothetical protein
VVTALVDENFLVHLELVVSSLAVGKALYPGTLIGERSVRKCPVSA